jgi:hypothetical protein
MKIKYNVVQSILFALILFTGFVFYKSAFAGNITVNFDPTLEGQKTFTLVCTHPIERENGDVLAIDEIADIQFFVVKDGVRTLADTDNTNVCKQSYDLTNVADGEYLYLMQTRDTDGRNSVDSLDTFTAIVKRQGDPKAPTGMTMSHGQLP